jgi:type II secretory pathway component PulJ
MTLIEVMVAGAIAVVALAAVMSFSIYGARSFTALGNYVDFDAKSRNALDVMSTDVRQANGCSTTAPFNSTNVTLLMATLSGTAYTINYTYNPAVQKLTRTQIDASGSQAKALLTNCSYFAFSYFLRNPTNGAWEVFTNDLDRADLCKLIRIDWVCSKTILGRATNSESVQSAKLVIRNR